MNCCLNNVNFVTIGAKDSEKQRSSNGNFFDTMAHGWVVLWLVLPLAVNIKQKKWVDNGIFCGGQRFGPPSNGGARITKKFFWYNSYSNIKGTSALTYHTHIRPIQPQTRSFFSIFVIFFFLAIWTESIRSTHPGSTYLLKDFRQCFFVDGQPLVSDLDCLEQKNKDAMEFCV